MAGWFRKGLSKHHTALAMVGAKPGDRVVVIGARDPELAAEIALVTGLNGSMTIVDPDASARARVEAAARSAGALVDFEDAPFDALPGGDASQDIVVLLADGRAIGDDQRTGPLREAMRLLRPGGRVIVIDGVRSGGLFRRSQEGGPRAASGDVLAGLDRAGTRAQRQLADVDGVAYYEARKP